MARRISQGDTAFACWVRKYIQPTLRTNKAKDQRELRLVVDLAALLRLGLEQDPFLEHGGQLETFRKRVRTFISTWGDRVLYWVLETGPNRFKHVSDSIKMNHELMQVLKEKTSKDSIVFSPPAASFVLFSELKRAGHGTLVLVSESAYGSDVICWLCEEYGAVPASDSGEFLMALPKTLLLPSHDQAWLYERASICFRLGIGEQWSPLFNRLIGRREVPGLFEDRGWDRFLRIAQYINAPKNHYLFEPRCEPSQTIEFVEFECNDMDRDDLEEDDEFSFVEDFALRMWYEHWLFNPNQKHLVLPVLGERSDPPSIFVRTAPLRHSVLTCRLGSHCPREEHVPGYDPIPIESTRVPPTDLSQAVALVCAEEGKSFENYEAESIESLVDAALLATRFYYPGFALKGNRAPLPDSYLFFQHVLMEFQSCFPLLEIPEEVFVDGSSLVVKAGEDMY